MMTADELFEQIKKEYPAVEKVEPALAPYLTVKIAPAEVQSLFAVLRDKLDFDYLDMVDVVDWLGPVDAGGYIREPNPNPFLPEGATPQAKPSIKNPKVNYRAAFELCYLATSLSKKVKVVVKTEVPRNAATLPSLVDVYKTADWQERELFDLFGIKFEGHPNLKKILSPEFIAGYPLRKDYIHQKDKYDD